MTGRNRCILNRSAEDWLEKYNEYMIDDLQEQISDYLSDMTVEDINTDDILDVYFKWNNHLPDPGEWAGSKAYEEYENAMDAKRDFELDR